MVLRDMDAERKSGERGVDCFLKQGGWAADQPGQISRGLVEFSSRDAEIRVGENSCERLG